MGILETLIDLLLNLDQYLGEIIRAYESWTYLLLFVVVFSETGLVVMAFLPTDSLLFASGTLAALGALNITLLFVLMVAATLGGDSANYWIGHAFGERAIKSRWIKDAHVERTQKFFADYGVQAVLLARFLPVTRMLVPFICGMGGMSYGRFLLYNATSGIGWVVIFLLGGYFFGGIPVVQQNFSVVIVAVVILSFLPTLLEYVRARRKQQRAARNANNFKLRG